MIQSDVAQGDLPADVGTLNDEEGTARFLSLSEQRQLHSAFNVVLAGHPVADRHGEPVHGGFDLHEIVAHILAVVMGTGDVSR